MNGAWVWAWAYCLKEEPKLSMPVLDRERWREADKRQIDPDDLTLHPKSRPQTKRPSPSVVLIFTYWILRLFGVSPPSPKDRPPFSPASNQSPCPWNLPACNAKRNLAITYLLPSSATTRQIGFRSLPPCFPSFKPSRESYNCPRQRQHAIQTRWWRWWLLHYHTCYIFIYRR